MFKYICFFYLIFYFPFYNQDNILCVNKGIAAYYEVEITQIKNDVNDVNTKNNSQSNHQSGNYYETDCIAVGLAKRDWAEKNYQGHCSHLAALQRFVCNTGPRRNMHR